MSTMSESRILLIEPDAVLAKTYEQALTRAGYELRRASSAQAAIHEVDAHTPDIIILELQLSAHNGVEFMYELRSYPEWQNIPVVVLSNIPEAESGLDKNTASKLGIKKYCYKPRTTLKKLIESIESEILAS